MAWAVKTNKAKQTQAASMGSFDHQQVLQMFEQFQLASTRSHKAQLAQNICRELATRAQAERGTLKALISSVEKTKADDELFDTRIRVLGEYVRHHVKDKQQNGFPNFLSNGRELIELGAMLMQREQQLQQ